MTMKAQQIYELLRERGSMKPHEIIAAMGSDVSKIVQRMVKDGYVERAGKRSRNVTFKLNGKPMPEYHRKRKLNATLADVRNYIRTHDRVTSEEIAPVLRIHTSTARIMLLLISLADNPNLSSEQRDMVAKAVEMVDKFGRVRDAMAIIAPVKRAVFGESMRRGRASVDLKRTEAKRRDSFERPIDAVCLVSERLADIDIPQMHSADLQGFVTRVQAARENLRKLQLRLTREI